MSHPRRLLIRGNKVFVSHNPLYPSLSTRWKVWYSSIGSKGSGELQFNYPRRSINRYQYNQWYLLFVMLVTIELQIISEIPSIQVSVR